MEEDLPNVRRVLEAEFSTLLQKILSWKALGGN